MKPGRYIRIGKLYLPITAPSAPDPYRSTYWVGPAARAARIKSCQNHGLASRTSNFAKIWAMLGMKGE